MKKYFFEIYCFEVFLIVPPGTHPNILGPGGKGLNMDFSNFIVRDFLYRTYFYINMKGFENKISKFQKSGRAVIIQFF